MLGQGRLLPSSISGKRNAKPQQVRPPPAEGDNDAPTSSWLDAASNLPRCASHPGHFWLAVASGVSGLLFPRVFPACCSPGRFRPAVPPGFSGLLSAVFSHPDLIGIPLPLFG